MSNEFYFKDRSLSRDQSHVMGILNVTPDSFSDGGHFSDLESAMQQAREMVASGAAIIDVGGESTRPGATPVSEQEELDRVMPVVERLIHEVDVIVSVDTSSPRVMKETAVAGVHLINDVRALQRDGAIQAAAQTGLPVCLMHMQGKPIDMQQKPVYRDVIDEVSEFLMGRVQACVAHGIETERILLDPGFGFGKTVDHNLRLLNKLSMLAKFNLPLLVGMSRKSMIDHVLDRSVEQRLPASIALAAAAVVRGAWIIRVHDVAESYDAIMMMNAMLKESR